MKRNALNWVLVAGLAVMLAGCKKSEAEPAPAPEKKAAESHGASQDPQEVKVAKELRDNIEVGGPEWAEVSGTLMVAGRVEADETRLERVGSPVTGRIAELRAVEGQTVKKGDVLALLNSTELSEGQFAYLRAMSQAQQAERAVGRAKQLLDAGVIGSAELQRREADFAQAAAEVKTWRERLRVLGMPDEAVARVEATKTVDSRTQVTASIDGVVLERKATQGQVVQPADALYVLADLTRVWLVADVPEQESKTLKVGKTLEASIPALERTVRGKLTFVSATVNVETHTVRVRMDLDNGRLEYKPAMLADIRLEEKPERRMVIPTAAVVREGNDDCVFVDLGNWTFGIRRVTLGGEFGEKRVVEAGLKEGERIAVKGGFHLNTERKRASLQSE